jgi:hypothetical protein
MILLHLANILLLFGITSVFIYYGSNFGSHFDNDSPQSFKSSWEKYGWFSLVLYLCQYLALLALPQAVFNFLGFILFNPFPDDPQIKVKPDCNIVSFVHFPILINIFVHFRNLLYYPTQLLIYVSAWLLEEITLI